MIVQREPWSSLVQFAALMRRHHCRVVWVTDIRSRDASVMSRLLSTEVQTHRQFTSTGCRDNSIVDIQGSEYDIAGLAELATDPEVSPALVEILPSRLVALDKLHMSARLRASGVPVPDNVAATDVSPDDAAARFGLPFLVKHRVGAGGQGVFVARTARAARSYVEECGVANLFYERVHHGDVVQFAAAHAEDRIVQHAAMESIRDDSSLGPAHRISTVAAPDIVEIGSRVAGVVGGAGLINLDLIRTTTGQVYVLDVNLRAWDSLVSLRAGGIDFAEGYLYALGLRSAPPRRRCPPPGKVFDSFPSSLFTRVRSGRRRGAVVLFVRQGWRYAFWLGPRYLLLTGWMLALALRDSARQSRSTTVDQLDDDDLSVSDRR